MGAYLARVDGALGAAQGLYPGSASPVGVATDRPAGPPVAPGTGGTAAGAAAAGEGYRGFWQSQRYGLAVRRARKHSCLCVSLT